MNKLLSILYCAVNLCFLIKPIFGFNVDIDSANKLHGPSNSMFGFSIALHEFNNEKWVIIGAPKKNFTAEPGRNSNKIIEGGAVFRCKPLDDIRGCIIIPFDKNSTRNTIIGDEEVDIKSYQWFGATVTTGGPNGPILACAPRYVFRGMQPNRVARLEPVGTCFSSSANFSDFHEISPCRTSNWGYHRQGSCQAGFSGAISKSNDRIYIGAPGSWYWQGQVYSVHPDIRFHFKPKFYDVFGAPSGQIHAVDVTDQKKRIFSTGESRPSEDDSYLGYSMVTGKFNQNNEGAEDIVIGMPRGDSLLGRVVVFNYELLNPYNMSGRQIGEYFGYSLCVADLNGDNLDDLIIGAPMYSAFNNENKYDVGRIYVFLQKETEDVAKTFGTFTNINGVNSKSRFGLALTKLGDINSDGFGDFAVGAPYDEPDGKGAVYIYLGSKSGPLEKPSQIIHAEQVAFGYDLQTFGFSLAGGKDLDNNGYPDLAVGAYLSDVVIVLRSKPVANVIASSKFLINSTAIDLEQKSCQVGNKLVTCAMYESCLIYNGFELPSRLIFQLSWLLDAQKPKTPRIFFIEKEENNHQSLNNHLSANYTLSKDIKGCFRHQVYFKNAADIQDKLSPIEIEMTYIPVAFANRNKRDLLPIIDQNKETSQRASINIQKNCGPDEVCIPNLQLKTNVPEEYILGSNKPFEVAVSIPNHGEDAFEATFYMNIPEVLNYKKVKQLSKDPRDSFVTCSETDGVLKCNLGNPLLANQVANFIIIFTPSQHQYPVISPSFELHMEVNSTNPEEVGSTFDNIEKKMVEKTINAELVVYGGSQPENEIYKSSDYKSLSNATKEGDIGPSIVHIYNIRNNGPAEIEEAIVNVHWPYKTNVGDDLMYLITEPETVGNIECEKIFNLNPNKLILDKKGDSLKNWLKARGAVEKENTNENVLHVSKTIENKTSVVTKKEWTDQEIQEYKKDQDMASPGDSSSVPNNRVETPASNTHGQITRYDVDQRSPTFNNAHATRISHSSRNYNQTQTNPSVSQSQSIHVQQNLNSNPQNNFRTVAFNSASQNIQNTPTFQPNVYHDYPLSNYDEQSNFINQQPQYFSTPNQNRYQIRSKRDAQDHLKAPCQRAQCLTLKCVVKNLGNNDEAYIAMRVRLVVETLDKLSVNAPINVSTMAVAYITQFPSIGAPLHPKLKSYEIVYQAIPETSLDSIVPLWAVILAAVAGTIILLLLIFLLYKCGFFKRNRPSSNAQERQPLNRNGYHGDEHL